MLEGMVRKYRKKPVVIEAIKLERHNISEVLRFVGRALDAWQENSETGENRIKIETKEGVMTASEGDYVIRGVSGEFYPCKPDIFEQTYTIEISAAKPGSGGE